LLELDQLIQDATAGDPISGLKWTHKSLRKIADALERKGYSLSLPTVSRLLYLRSYSLKVNHKRVAGKQSPGRDEQFHYIEQRRKWFLQRKWPVISVDTKKNELIGNFKNAGPEWRRQARPVNMYDFPSQASGKAIPYGIYDLGRNEGYVVVGLSHDTPTFAVTSIRSWWIAIGKKAYPECTHLLIEADCGGSNGNRCRMWKVCLQHFANEFGLKITVTHFPTGASKWNPIEHRMFNLISKNWEGQPLESYETVLKHIRTTTSTTGFRCKAQLDKKTYVTGIKVPPEEEKRIRIKPHKVFPDWNYTIHPQTIKW
jgi:DDE family transposase